MLFFRSKHRFEIPTVSFLAFD